MMLALLPSISFILLSFVNSASSAPTSNDPVVLERLHAIPEGWQRKNPVDPDHVLHFRVAVKQDNAYEFEQHVLAISDPAHSKYGQHMGRDELKSMLRPSREATYAIWQWLGAEDVAGTHIYDDGQWINFNLSTAKAELMLNTKFHFYHNKVAKLDRIRTLQYSVPASLHKYVHMIQPTTRFGQYRPERSTIFEESEIVPVVSADAALTTVSKYNGPGLDTDFCNSTVTPQCLRNLYGIGDARGSSTNGNRIGVAGYLDQIARYDDYAAFTSQYAPNALKDNFSYVLINGGLSTQTSPADSSEANLDVQYAFPLSNPTPATYYSTGGHGQLIPDLDQPTQADNQNEPYLDFLTYILDLPDSELPATLTTSYGEDEQSVPPKYANTTCSLFAQLGARGVSVIFSSGDTGPGSACQTNDGKNTTRFLPIFPASCPFVTSVGGTVGVQPERAVSFSSGGFSDYFPRPSYQDRAVPTYLRTLGKKWSGLYNPAGRGFPDVSAQAVNFTVIDKGVEKRIGGTSASAPTFAAVVALLNSARLDAGKPNLGFLNPLIYSKGGKGFTDIVVGKSRGCTGRDVFSGEVTPVVERAGWEAVEGWDPVTGLGTPRFGELVEMVGGGGRGNVTAYAV